MKDAMSEHCNQIPCRKGVERSRGSVIIMGGVGGGLEGHLFTQVCASRQDMFSSVPSKYMRDSVVGNN
jgi:hypothetical protein